MSKPTAKIELTHEEWVEAQELALSIESLVDGQQGSRTNWRSS